MGDAAWKIHDTLQAKGFKLVRPSPAFVGPISVHGKLATIEIEVRDPTFANLPVVKLLDASALPDALAHQTDGVVCYVGEGGLPLDLHDPGGSILRVLLEVEAALERSFGANASAEFEQELASYWAGAPVYFALPRTGPPAVIHAEAISKDDGGSLATIVVSKGAWANRKPANRKPVTILRFDKNLHHSPDLPPKTLAAALDYVARQDDLPVEWRKAAIDAAASSRWVFLAAPNAIIGWAPIFSGSLKVLMDRSQGIRPAFFRRTLEGTLNSIELLHLTGIETDLAHCVERNLLGQPTLIGKTIALIGCGTIGSHLARFLVQSGAGCEATFFIYDIESLGAGNLGRHLLGFEALGERKVDALAKSLRGFHPDVNVTPMHYDATKDWPALERVDLIIDATGEPNVSAALNDMWLRSPRDGANLALLHSWVIGNGVAAQSFLNLKDGHACYWCLKTGFGGDWRYNPLRDAKSPLLQAPGRCGEAGYVPFGVEAPVAAAGLAVRAALDWAGGKPSKRLRTTILDHVAGRERVPWASPEPLKQCAACGKK